MYWDLRLDVNHKAKQAMESKKVSFASKEEAESVTHQIYGGISPLVYLKKLKFLLIKSIRKGKNIYWCWK